MLSYLRVVLIVLLSAASVAAADPAAITAEGEEFHGALLSADSAGQIVLQTEGGRRNVASTDLVRWGTCVELDRPPVILLHDGTILVAGILEVEREQMAVDSDTLGLVRLPRDQVAAIVMRLPASNLKCDRLLDTASRSEEDTTRVLLLNGDQVRGELTAFDDRSISIRTDVGLVQLEIDRVSTVTFAHAVSEQSDPLHKASLVGLADGSRVAVTAFVVDEQTATLTTAAGLTCKCDAQDVVFLQPVSPRIVYLSDLTPTGYRHVPYLERTWKYEAGRNVLGGVMRCADQMYFKGLGMHTAARISYVPPEGAEKFLASLGIDDLTSGMGSVRFRIFVDGTQNYVSPTVRGLEKPVPISVDLKGAQRLDLVIDFTDRADVQDHANWLDARFVLGE